MVKFNSDFPRIEIKIAAISIQKQFKLKRSPPGRRVRVVAQEAATGKPANFRSLMDS